MESSLLLAEGSPPDWDALIAQHNRRVIVALLGHGVPIERAKEVAQETWAKLMQQHGRGTLLVLSLPGLAITQALFLAKDEARRDRRRPSTTLSDSLPDSNTTDAPLLAREQSEVAVRVLQGLAPNARRVFELCYDEPSLSHADVALRVGLSVQRVRQ